jgi:hypothetical protein
MRSGRPVPAGALTVLPAAEQYLFGALDNSMAQQPRRQDVQLLRQQSCRNGPEGFSFRLSHQFQRSSLAYCFRSPSLQTNCKANRESLIFGPHLAVWVLVVLVISFVLLVADTWACCIVVQLLRGCFSWLVAFRGFRLRVRCMPLFWERRYERRYETKSFTQWHLVKRSQSPNVLHTVCDAGNPVQQSSQEAVCPPD